MELRLLDLTASMIMVVLFTVTAAQFIGRSVCYVGRSFELANEPLPPSNPVAGKVPVIT